MTLDIIFGVMAMLGFYMGYSRGIISTVFTVISYTVGIIAAIRIAPAFTRFLTDIVKSDNEVLMYIAGIILSFVIIMLILRLVSNGLEGILKSANINIINQMAGGALLCAVSIFLYSSMLWFADRSHLIDATTKSESVTYPYTKQFPNQVKGITQRLKPMFIEFWNETLDVLDKVEDMGVERTESDPTIYDIDEEEGG